jgi:dynein heavy chain
LEDINNILNNGKIPNLYTKDHENQIIENIKEAYKTVDSFKEIQEDQAKVFEIFERQARDSLHVVLAMSPIGDAFKTRLRMFPALVNCCTIDWFLPWPKDALQSVAEFKLENVEDLPDRDGIVSICVDM